MERVSDGQVHEENGLVGVGIVFQSVEGGTLYVKRMREDSPAARSGLVNIGDCLCEVNGR
jgi:C-terminal processing protease CtpA/Prc